PTCCSTPPTTRTGTKTASGSPSTTTSWTPTPARGIKVYGTLKGVHPLSKSPMKEVYDRRRRCAQLPARFQRTPSLPVGTMAPAPRIGQHHHHRSLSRRDVPETPPLRRARGRLAARQTARLRPRLHARSAARRLP